MSLTRPSDPSPGEHIPSRLRRRLAAWYVPFALIVAAVFYAQYYAIYATPYLDLAKYAAGRERMPFQARELMRYPLAWALHSPLFARLTYGHKGIDTPARLFTEIVALVCLLLSGWSAIRLFRWAEPRARVPLLPAAILLVVLLFDFSLTVPYGFPYDLPSLAFLGWGLYFVLTARFLPLLLLFPFATWNRETSLFLVGALAASAAFQTGRFNLRAIRPRQWLQLASLSFLWAGVVLALQHRYAANPTEAGSRLSGNFHALLHPVLWPNILSASAFLLPYIWLRRDRIRQPTLRACVLLLPLWILLLLWKGQILELRIYGDISVLVAVAASIVFTAGFTPANLPFCGDPAPGDSLKGL